MLGTWRRYPWWRGVVLGTASLFLRVAAGAATPAGSPAAAPWYVDADVGLRFDHDPGLTGGLHLAEIMGPGCALVDLDGDGDLDAYLVQGGSLDSQGQPLAGPVGDRVWRNDLPPAGAAGRAPRFVDATAAWLPAGLIAGYGMGVAVGDVEGDGRPDLFLPRDGADLLLRNVGGSHFVDATAAAGVSDPGWTVAASFVDLDRDGRLDLYVADYVAYRPVRCALPSGRPDYCGPKSFAPAPDRLYRSLGSGRFAVPTPSWLSPHEAGPGLGVLAADLDGNGWPDLLVANDGAPNRLWWNDHGPPLREDGLLAGVALDRSGHAGASMGLASGDVDGDGRQDLFATQLTGETNVLWSGIGDGMFTDRSAETGLGPPSLPWTGFGTALLDPDLDGDLDVVISNGGVHLADQQRVGDPPLATLAQPGQLAVNDGRGRFADAPGLAGALAAPAIGKGLAVGDVDNDGDPDLLLCPTAGAARLLLDRAGDGARWLGLRLLTAGREALGARALLVLADGRRLERLAHTDGSYASASDPRVVFGLGRAPASGEPSRLEVVWPDGARERFPVPPPARYTTLVQGRGQALGKP
jgi:hypothetical protein